MIYLDNAATSYPKPEGVYKRVDEILRTIGGNPGRSSHRMAIEASRIVYNSRESLAKLFNIKDSSRVVFTKNATEAANVALKGLLKPGDHVVTTSFEHNSIARSLLRLEHEGVKVTRLSGASADMVLPSDIAEALTKRTALVCVTHASNVFGTIEPIAAIGEALRKRAIPLMADCAQTAGAIEVDVEGMNIAILIGTGHKALFGPQGVGFLYVKDGLEPKPLIDGGTAEMDSSLDIPDRLETGTLNTPGIGGLGRGVEFILKQGVSKIRRHEERLIARILEGFKKIPAIEVIGAREASARVSLVSFNIAGKEPEEVGVRLDSRYSIMTRCGMHCAPEAHRAAGTYPKGAVRVSPGYFNTEEEVEEFLKAITAIAKQG